LCWLGIVLGLVCFGASVQGAPVVERRIMAFVGVPTPEEITAYTTAICGAAVVVVSTLLLIIQKIDERPRGRKRKARTEHVDDDAGK
jgi:hypothetical protein